MPLPIFEPSFWIGLPFAILIGVVLRKYFERLKARRKALIDAINSLEANKRH